VHSGQRELALLAVFTWSVGAFGYAVVAMLVVARTMAQPLRPADLTPPYWVSMGATAITVVAGASIVRMTPVPVATAAHELIAGASLVFWMFGTWLIPALVAAGIWRHVVHRVPLRYESALWSVVFPLGMYGVGSHYLSTIDRLPLIEAISTHEAWVALAAWTLTFVAMLVGLASITTRRAADRRTASTATAVVRSDRATASRRRPW
jgi:tellurite resistance protein TehA-like permease